MGIVGVASPDYISWSYTLQQTKQGAKNYNDKVEHVVGLKDNIKCNYLL